MCSSLFLLFACGGSGDGVSGENAATTTGFAGDGQLDNVVEAIRQKYDLPAIAVIIIHNDQVVERSAVGSRSADKNTAVTVNDQWHLGSITKSMTSLLAALLVRDGFIQWSSTLADIFPELVGTMRPEYEDVSLEELLSHTSGLPVLRLPLDIPNHASYHTDTRPLPEQRQEIVDNSLVLTSSATQGEYEYNNLGYIVAGTMLERVTGSAWESLIQSYLFNPLVMTQAGFGAPDTQGTLAQPVGHRLDNGDWKPWDPSVESFYEMLPAFGPAGTGHASLDDMAAYLGLHLKGLRGEAVAGFLTTQEFAKLYTSVSNIPDSNNTYALGWEVSDYFIEHRGSNGYWNALADINHYKNAAFFIVTNAYDDACSPNCRASSAIKELRLELHERFDAAFL